MFSAISRLVTDLDNKNWKVTLNKAYFHVEYVCLLDTKIN